MFRSWSSLRRRRLLAAVVALAAATLAAVLIAVAMGRDGSSNDPLAVAPLPTIDHQPTSDGWRPVDLALPDDTYSLRPTKVTEAGVAVASAFDLESTTGHLDDKAAADMLRVDPPIEFTVKRESGSRLRIQPAAELRRETAYHFTLVDPGDQHEIRSWAFQTESPLRVVQSLPGDKAVAVPAASGIELTFSHEGVTGVEQRFHIVPVVEGRFEAHKRVVVFVPSKLEYRTLYTVTVDPGIGVEGEALTMEQPFSFSFETSSQDVRDDQIQTLAPTFTRLLNESAPANPPVLQMLSYDPQAKMPFEVYLYADVSAFTDALTTSQGQPQWSYWGRRNFRLDTAGLDRVATFSATLVQQQQSYYAASYAVFPEALPAGFYLVQSGDGLTTATAQTLLQVTDVAAYASVSKTKTLVWVNDVATKAPIDNARVKDQHGHTFRTGSDGVAFFDTPGEILPPKTNAPQPLPYSNYTSSAAAQGHLLVSDSDRVAVVPLQDASPIGFVGYRYDARYGSIYSSGGSPDFWSYVYSDRHLYRKTDDVRVWGVAKRREGFKPGEQLTLRLTGSDYVGYNHEPSVVAQTSVDVSDLGTFEGDLKLDAVGPGYYQLEVRAGDELVTSTYLQVEDFVKPAYKIDITPSKRAVVDGEAVTFDIAVQFFDGSPVPFIELAISGDVAPGGAEQTIRTDAQGKASIPYTAVAGYLGSVAYRQIYARPVGPEEGEISGQAMLYVLPATVTVDAVNARVANGTGIVAGALREVDFTAFDKSDQPYTYSPYAGSPVAGSTVGAHVAQISYKKTEVGETYDFIAKVTRKQYSYETVETGAGTFTATTAADGTFALRFPVGAEQSYRVDLSAQDDAGRTARASTWVSGDDLPYFPSNGDQNLSIVETNVSSDPNFGYQPPSRYSDGEGVDLSVRRGHDRGEEGAGVAYLFQRAQSGIRAYDVQASPRYSFDFKRDDAPNIIVGGVQFNGFGYEQAMGDYNAAFDYKDSSIGVTLAAGRKRYAPGDDVTLSVETRDAAGNPVAAEAVLSAVDEAIFRLQGGGGETDIAQQLYRPLPSGVLSTYVPSFGTRDPYAQAANARAGQGGPDTGGGLAGIAAPATQPGGADPRKDFRDTALFQTVRTDSRGRGSVTFKLPDNITSWRVTSYAITKDIRAGSGVTDIAVGLPFFVDATISEAYLAADHPVIALRSFGSDLKPGVQVQYSVSIPSLGGDAIGGAAAAFERASVTLPPLADGEHEVTIRATSGVLADAIVRKMIVVTSRLRKGDARFYELAPGVALEGVDSGRTRVIFSDHNRGRYYGDLLQLGATYGDRVDQMLARSLSQDLLKTYFGAEDAGPPARFDATLYQTNDGGIALFPYADDDLTLTTRVASVAAGRFSDARLAQYFRKVLDDPKETRERSIIALFGLAATGAPVMPSIDQFARASDLSVREHLYLGLAALAAGDDDVAREQYRQVMLRYAERRDPSVRVRVGVDQDDILEATSLAADLAAGLGDASAPALFAYTNENRTTDLLVELDRVSYLARALPRLPSAAVRFSYVLDGQRKEATLAAGRSLTLSLTPAELSALAPQRLDGDVGIATFFETPFDPASVARDPDVSITRTIDVDGGGIGEGDLVQIRLDYVIGPQALDGCYQITDLTPSGLRPVSRTIRPYDAGQGEILYPYLIDGQRVSFCVYRSDVYHPAAYWARVVTKGDYAVEPAIIQSQRSSTSFNFTPGSAVHVQ